MKCIVQACTLRQTSTDVDAIISPCLMLLLYVLAARFMSLPPRTSWRRHALPVTPRSHLRMRVADHAAEGRAVAAATNVSRVPAYFREP